jgi:hypothetical protein
MIKNTYSTGDVSGNTNEGGFIGYTTSSNVSNSQWLNTSNNPSVAFGNNSNNQISLPQTEVSYFYNVSNSPMNSWDTNIWDFYNLTFQHLDYENFVESSTPVQTPSQSSTSLNSLPSIGTYSALISFILILGILFF